MRVIVGSKSFFIARRGLLEADELNSTDLVLGVDGSGGLSYQSVLRTRNMRAIHELLQINTDRSVLYTNPTQPVWTEKGICIASDLKEALKDDYSCSKIEGQIGKSVDYRPCAKTTIGVRHAYALGVLTRRVSNADGRLIIRVPKSMPNTERNSLIQKMERSAGLHREAQVHNGKFWDWIDLGLRASLLKEAETWRLLKVVPENVRLSNNEIVRSFIEGCLDVRNTGDYILFGFEDMELMRFCCLGFSLAASIRFSLTPVPIYCPAEFRFKPSQPSYGRVRSVVPRHGINLEIEFPKSLWDPFVDGFLLKSW